MKKTIKKFLSGISAVTVLTTGVFGGFSVAASSLDDYIPIDDKGMFYSDNGNYQMYYPKERSSERIYIYKMIPQLNEFKFVLSDDVSYEEVNDRIVQIIEKYYPENNLNTDDESQIYDDIAYISSETYSSGATYYTVSFSSKIINDSEDERVIEAKKNSKAIMYKLYAENLISEFYDIGEVYQVDYYDSYQYFPYYDPVDIELIKKFIEENNLACTMETGMDIYDPESYSLVPSEEMSFEEYFSVAADLYEATGEKPDMMTRDIYVEMCDENSLETMSPIGDANGDNELNVSDCAFIARKLAKRETIEIALNPAADYNNDGKVTVSDAATIARELAKKDL
ncbi:MAG: hypothetical protein E7508_10385 [Ruminococcus sp.]|nr:hypothetical protein [Ruminococcus sp.]